MRQMVLGMDNSPAAFPMGLRESDPTRRYSRADAVGSGTGLGRNVSIAGRPHTTFSTPNNMINYNKTFGDNPIQVGPMAAIPAAGGDPWT